MRDVPVAIVVSPRDWAERLHRFLADHGGARVRARILDAREAAEDGHEVLVAEDLTSFLTPRLIDDLHALGRRVLGVYDPAEPWGRDHLVSLGVDATIPADAAPEEFVRSIVDLAVDLRGPGDVVGGDAAPDRERSSSSAAIEDGAVVAVGGPPGGAGVTEVAIHLAATLGDDARTLLIDADLVAPAVAQRLQLDVHPNLRTAVDVFEHQRGAAESCVIPCDAGFDVVGGSPHPTAWQELRPREVVRAVRGLAEGRRRVIIDLGSGIEELPTVLGPHRHGVVRSILGDVDRIIAVCAPSPIGVSRLVRWMADVRRIAPSTPLLVAVNRTPAGRYRRAELEDEICHNLGTLPVGFLPEDRAVGTAAWAGELAPPRAAFVRGVGTLAAALEQSLTVPDAPVDDHGLEPAEVGA